MRLGEHDGDEGPEDERDPGLAAVPCAPLAPPTEEELAWVEYLEETEAEGPATWKPGFAG
ncbi:hypothetical protein [Polyangium fumosum]|uniref:Uncharacterized protein n=1 Tax=Polyangium fumosum TaxID=889272 RepID=A0A4U1J980_9BACT|nr:hypothetical protein [Polyangium fumosum]TKD03427.1 hypothetical protein E8A74_26045 [Polyangium fumosum]